MCARRVAASKTWLGLDVARDLAAERGGECLSTEYPVGRSKVLRWRCVDGHEWEMPIAAVRHMGQWCPVCASGLAERFCRAMFERVFDTTFPKARPRWLRNSRGRQMELDGFNADLRIAFEYHGEQHYKHNAFFHEKASLARRMEDDNAKLALCSEHGVTLIVVPYTVTFDGLQHYIYQECAYRGIAVERKPVIDIDKLDYYPSKDLERMRRFAEAKGGKCLAESFQGVLAPALWECAQGHRWRVSFRGLYHDETWCPVCAGSVPRTLAEMQAIARERGGECLATEFKGLKTKLCWRCANGHEWKAAANDVVHSGSWCPKCAGVAPLSLDDAREAAKSRGGACLSTEYINNRTKMLWRCAKGHEWVATLGEIKSGNWCAVCSRKAKLTVDEMRVIAKERGGECLSDQYVNLTTKLHWRCSLGHEWWAVPDNIKHRKSWCPECARTNRPRKAVDSGRRSASGPRTEGRET